MELNRVNLGEELNGSTKIYRYMSIEQFKVFIEKNQTSLTRISSWPDKWENPIRNLPVQFDDGEPHFAISLGHSDLFAQCWTTKEESDAMWRIYSKPNQGVKIRTSIDKFQLINDLCIYGVSKIYYYNELIDGLNSRKSLKDALHLFADGLIKRNAFSHEDEIRLITRNDRRMVRNVINDTDKFMYLNLEAKEFIEEIVIDPRSSNQFLDEFRQYCGNIGLKITPIKSDLYDDNIFDKTKLVTVFKSVK
jgi:hypothetical protein